MEMAQELPISNSEYNSWYYRVAHQTKNSEGSILWAKYYI